MTATVALVGRPNVGKSTLFNRLVGKRLALVDNQPGVTRDLREGEARLGPLKFTVIDTAGLEEVQDDSLQGRMRRLTERAVDMADISLFIIDARAGITATDQLFADLLRKRSGKVYLIANKSEGRAGEEAFYEAFSLGLGEPIAVSAEHGEGMSDLLRVLTPVIDELNAQNPNAEVDIDVELDDFDSEEEIDPVKPNRPIQVSVIGRPNAGKSTLINRIIGEDRLLTGPEAGITRDAISVQTKWGGQEFRIFDTAGMRKRAKVQEKLEKLSVSDGLRAVKFSEVVVVLLDAQTPFEQQDLRIADLAEREGRAVVVAINKWDLVEDKEKRLKDLHETFTRLLPQLKGAPMVPISAETGKGVERLQKSIIKAYRVWNRRISTAALNRWLLAQLEQHPPPAPGGRRIRLRYMTQVKTRPPSFVIMCSHPDKLPTSYSRFLVNGMRVDFDMPGTPIRLYMRKQDNPYEGKRAKHVTKLQKHIKPRRDY